VKSKIVSIEERNTDPSINLALDTLLLKKQCIIFVNTKRGAESVAEKISQIIYKDKKHDYKSFIDTNTLSKISSDILKVLSSPTKQCHRLADLIKYGISFHHSGLVSEQRKLIEENFRLGNIKIIVATPTLAMGVDLPAFRVIIRDLKRYGLWGLQYIPVLEYEQQAGRAGRPSYDTYGEAICIAGDKSEKAEIKDKYVDGLPEPIVSKLAVEPIMRTYILSLVASEFIRTDTELEGFFQETFYAKHYGDTEKLKQIIYRMVEQLEEWGFIQINNKVTAPPDPMKDFVSALKYSFKNPDEKLSATLLGKRVSELYLDPYTAHQLIEALQSALLRKDENKLNDYSIMHLVCSSLELRPLLRVKSKEMDGIQEDILRLEESLLTAVPDMFDEYYEEFINTIKTANFFMEWLDEKDEEYLLEKYDVRPGELHAKKEIADWLLYSSEELSKLLKMHVLVKDLARLRFRLKYGAKEELIPLLQLKNIGRIRARKLFDNRIKDIAGVKTADIMTLTQLLGKTTALDIKRQVGQEFSEEKIMVPENKRKGQKNLDDY